MPAIDIRYPYDGDGARGFETFAHAHAPDALVTLYRSMLRIRRIEEAIERRYHEDEMKTPIHLAIGQEATAVGCAAALQPADLVYCSHRTHGPYLAKGGDLHAMMCELYGRVNGCSGSRGGSMHLIDKRAGVAGTSAIVGGAVPIGAGAALAARMKGEDRVVVVFLGDATTEEGVMSETLNFAALKQLPGVFLCENNFYSVQSPLAARQPPGRDLGRWAAAHEVSAVRVDGTNVLAVHDAVLSAVTRARAGGGPTFIEARVYRFRAHAGAGTSPTGRAPIGSSRCSRVIASEISFTCATWPARSCTASTASMRWPARSTTSACPTRTSPSANSASGSSSRYRDSSSSSRRRARIRISVITSSRTRKSDAPGIVRRSRSTREFGS